MQNTVYFIFISNKGLLLKALCKKGIYGQFHILDITFRGQIFGNKTFSCILLFKT